MMPEMKSTNHCRTHLLGAGSRATDVTVETGAKIAFDACNGCGQDT
jgi:hypothetical protein